MPLRSGPLTLGRDETYWQESLTALSAWSGASRCTRIMVLAPHPDDEVLACGGALQRWAQQGKEIELCMLTNGEACFGSTMHAAVVARQRRAESLESHRRLGLHRVQTHWLGLPDGQLRHHGHRLRQWLRTRIHSDTLLVSPLTNDGHPDHDAVGGVARQLATEQQLALLQYPVWFWHWGDVTTLATPGIHKLELSMKELYRKREAIAAFDSQVNWQLRTEPVLPKRVLRHFRRSFEIFFQ